MGEVEEPQVQKEGPRTPPVMVGPHPLGGIGVTARGPDGTQVVARLAIEEAAIVASLLQSWITIMMNTAMAMAEERAQQAQQIVLPR
jgi:hypothetical protein